MSWYYVMNMVKTCNIIIFLVRLLKVKLLLLQQKGICACFFMRTLDLPLLFQKHRLLIALFLCVEKKYRSTKNLIQSHVCWCWRRFVKSERRWMIFFFFLIFNHFSPNIPSLNLFLHCWFWCNFFNFLIAKWPGFLCQWCTEARRTNVSISDR